MTGDERLAKVAEVLAGHREDFTYPDSCLCEDAIPGRDSEGHFAAHVAAALVPLLDEFRAEAWEEAHDKFCSLGNYCSTHMKPGDRHLLSCAALAAAEPAPRCAECGPGYRIGDEGCRHGTAAAEPDAGER